MTTSPLEINSDLGELENPAKSKDVVESSTSQNLKETDTDNLPSEKILNTVGTDVCSSKIENKFIEETESNNTSIISLMSPKLRLSRPSHHVPWKQYAVNTYNKSIFDFMRTIRNRKKKEIKRLKRKKTECTSHCRCQEQVKKAKEIMKSKVFSSKLNELTLQQKMYIDKLVENMCKKLHGEEFTIEEKLMCLSIYKKSEIIYEYLNTFLTLPKVPILRKFMRTVHFDTGITLAMENRLKEVARKKKGMDKCVILMFGSVILQPQLNYSLKLDKIVGFEDWGEEFRSNKFADEALVFAIRGIDCEWMLPVAYSFYNEFPKVSRLIRLFRDVVTVVKETGFNIVACICDQGNPYEAALDKLRMDTIKKRGPDTENNRGTILVHGVEIVPLFNPPELLTDFRNILVSKDLEFFLNSRKRPANWNHERELHIKENNNKILASWAHIELAYRKDCQSNQSSRKVPTLTYKNVYTEELEKSEVNCVIDVFNEKVAEYLNMLSCSKDKSETFAEEIQVPVEGYFTSYIVNFLKKLSDAINGMKKENDPSFEMRTVLTNSSFHHSFFEEAKELIGHMRFVEQNTNLPVNERIYCLENLITTIQGFQILWKKLNKLGFHFLKTRDFNLELLDNFSSKNEDLTCIKFARNFKNFCYLDVTI